MGGDWHSADLLEERCHVGKEERSRHLRYCAEKIVVRSMSQQW